MFGNAWFNMETGETVAIDRCQQGDVSAFGELYDTYIKKIYDFVYYKTLHRETAEDLTSVVFTKALEHINSFTNTEGSFSAWLYRIARNTVIDHYRTRKIEKDVDDVWDLSSSEDVAHDTDVRLKLEKAEKLLGVLTSEQRDIVIMRLWQDMTHADIATVIGKSEGAVKVAYSRAITKLRGEMSALLILLMLFQIIKTKG